METANKEEEEEEEEEDGEEEDEEEEEESVSRLEVLRFTGQSLIKSGRGESAAAEAAAAAAAAGAASAAPPPSLKDRARLLTGIPLIKATLPTQDAFQQQQQQHQQQLYFLQQQVLLLLCQQQLQQQQQQQHLKPPSASQPPPSVAAEDEQMDLSHLLPMDLLADEGKEEEEQQMQQDKNGTRRTRPRQVLRHTESLHVFSARDQRQDQQQVEVTPACGVAGVAGSSCDSGHHHQQLRKTTSWTCSATSSSFCLFPKTSRSDLLCSVRRDLQQQVWQQQQVRQQQQQVPKAHQEEEEEEADRGGSNPSRILEEALRSLRLVGREEEEGGLGASRKF